MTQRKSIQEVKAAREKIEFDGRTGRCRLVSSGSSVNSAYLSVAKLLHALGWS